MLSKRMASLMVGGALTAALIMAVGHALDKAGSWYMKAAFVIAMACVAIGEYLAWHNSATAYHERRAGSFGLWALLGIVLSGGVFYTNFSSTAGNNDLKAGIQKTAFTSYVDLDKTEKELTAEVDRIEQRLKMAPQRTPDAAQAAIQRFEADRFWKSTNGCKETKGPQTREFCSQYASAVADKSMGTEALTLREELKLKTAELKQVRADRSKAPAAVSDDQAHVSAIARIMHVSTETARTGDGMVIPIMTQAMLLLGGILTANEAFRGKERLPWIDRAKWARRRNYLMALFGLNHPEMSAPRTEADTSPIDTFHAAYRRHTARLGVEPVRIAA